MPGLSKEAKYYILQSQIAEKADVSNADIINIFENAVRNDATVSVRFKTSPIELTN